MGIHAVMPPAVFLDRDGVINRTVLVKLVVLEESAPS